MSRLKEPSTWAGIGLILTAITPVLPLAYATPAVALVTKMIKEAKEAQLTIV